MGICLVCLLDIICFLVRWRVYCFRWSWVCGKYQGPLSKVCVLTYREWVHQRFCQGRPSETLRATSLSISFLLSVQHPWNIFKCFAFPICVLYKMFAKYWFPSTRGLKAADGCFVSQLWFMQLLLLPKAFCVPASSADLGSALGTGSVEWWQLGLTHPPPDCLSWCCCPALHLRSRCLFPVLQSR